MTDEPLPPDDDTGPPADPFEAELVAYLDGELEPAAARQIENRLAADPVARDKAAALKKTYDLLDYLPKPEPSPNFTNRTLERLPVTKSAPVQPVVEQQLAPHVNQSANAPTVMSSSAGVPMAVAMSSGSGFHFAPAPTRWGLWAAGVLLAVSVCAAAGYFVSGALSPHNAKQQPPRDPADEQLATSDHPVVERLPLYAAVDDMEFVTELAKPDLFGDDPVVAFEPIPKTPAVEPEKVSGAAFTKLATAFKALPPARQQSLRDLDKQLHALDGPIRDQRFRVLEVYTVWLDKLPEAERKHILTAETGKRRLDEIRNVRGQQWLASLPPVQREKLRTLSAAGQAELIKQWKDEELARREEWAFHRTHAEDIVANRNPWPFETANSQKEVIEFVRHTFRPDDPSKCRLEEAERHRYNQFLTAAQEQGGWSAWYAYGRSVYGMVKKYDRFLLPEPAVGEPVTTYIQLGKAERWFDKGRAKTLTQPLVGKWPDFALTVHNFAQTEKGEKIMLPTLGPTKPSDFKEPLRNFVNKELLPALSHSDRTALAGLEGKWPEYSHGVTRYAKQYNLSAPGVMLPGPPKRWEQVYGGLGIRPKP